MSKLPKGCDQQGRYPEAAEACTEVGVSDEDSPAPILLCGVVIVLTVGLIAFIAGYFA